jgi:predicted thioesterase
MIRNPRVGEEGELCFTVSAEHGISVAGTDVPPVLSTPSLIWFLEHAAIEALRPLLEPDECSVGVHIDVEHLAATPLGMEVVCKARVIHNEGPVTTFQVQAHDQHELVARGLHKRRVVPTSRLAKRIRRKSSDGDRGA